MTECTECGRDTRDPVTWEAPTTLWHQVTNHEPGTLCCWCFDLRCMRNNVNVTWKAVAEPTAPEPDPAPPGIFRPETTKRKWWHR